MNDEAILVLASGASFRGRPFGHRGRASGEVVFNTSLTGYQEILTDPSYRGQLVAMTNPQIGNTGVNDDDAESSRVWLGGLIVRELSPVVSSWRATESLGDYLAKRSIVGIEGLDTRALTRELRARGSMLGVLSSDGGSVDELVAEARALGDPLARNLVAEVTTAEPYTWREGLSDLGHPWGMSPTRASTHRIVAYDFGIKRNILRQLVQHGFEVEVVPAGTSAADVLALRPQGVFLSNGPGDPAHLPSIVGEVGKLVGRVPMFGICLGFQLAGMALGARSYKLAFGHHGGNHPVRSTATGRVEITSQNHGYGVDADSLPATVEPTHWSLNDGTLEGFRHREVPLMAVQYHPEAAPGPHDSHNLFDAFIELIEGAGDSGRGKGSTDA